jgi:hypothetical protein
MRDVQFWKLTLKIIIIIIIISSSSSSSSSIFVDFVVYLTTNFG